MQNLSRHIQQETDAEHNPLLLPGVTTLTDLESTYEKPITDVDEAIEYASSNNSYRFQIVAFCVVGVMFMTDAMEMTLLSFLYPCMKHYWDLGDETADNIVSAVYLGQLFGSLLSGPMADTWGRKPVSLIGMSIVAVAGTLSSFSPDVWTFIALRSITGIGIGSNAIPYDLLSEVTPVKYRGRVLTALNFWWCIGSVCTVLLAWALLSQHNGWRTLVVCCSMPVYAAGAFMLWLPESPRWLLSEGRVREAEEVLQKIARTNGMPPPLLALKRISPSPSLESESIREFSVLFRGKERRNKTLVSKIMY
jgi:putative MFS transporter